MGGVAGHAPSVRRHWPARWEIFGRAALPGGDLCDVGHRRPALPHSTIELRRGRLLAGVLAVAARILPLWRLLGRPATGADRDLRHGRAPGRRPRCPGDAPCGGPGGDGGDDPAGRPSRAGGYSHAHPLAGPRACCRRSCLSLDQALRRVGGQRGAARTTVRAGRFRSGPPLTPCRDNPLDSSARGGGGGMRGVRSHGQAERRRRFRSRSGHRPEPCVHPPPASAHLATRHRHWRRYGVVGHAGFGVDTRHVTSRPVGGHRRLPLRRGGRDQRIGSRDDVPALRQTAVGGTGQRSTLGRGDHYVGNTAPSRPGGAHASGSTDRPALASAGSHGVGGCRGRPGR